MSRKRKFSTEEASVRLLSSMEVAINNMIDEVRKPVDTELSGSQRKAELQSIKQTATDAKELLIEYQRLEQMVKELRETGGIEGEQDYSGGFAEKFSKYSDIMLLGLLMPNNMIMLAFVGAFIQGLTRVFLCSTR